MGAAGLYVNGLNSVFQVIKTVFDGRVFGVGVGFKGRVIFC